MIAFEAAQALTHVQLNSKLIDKTLQNATRRSLTSDELDIEDSTTMMMEGVTEDDGVAADDPDLEHEEMMLTHKLEGLEAFLDNSIFPSP